MYPLKRWIKRLLGNRTSKPTWTRRELARLRLEPLEDRVAPSADFTMFTDPDPATGNDFGASVVPLSTGNVVITAPGDSAGGTNAGAVYLFNGATGALISTLLGSSGNHIGSNGVTALSNGNFVLDTPNWGNGLGAVTWGSGVTGVAGTISAANSLAGSIPGDDVGNGDAVGDDGVTSLSNGNYVVDSPYWNNEDGAVTWGSGVTGVAGTVSAANSLVGSIATDGVGWNGVTALSNGNYVVDSSWWDVNDGAVTWGSGATGIVGTISAANSLVGSVIPLGIGGDRVGADGVTALSNGNYVIDSPEWGDVAGAVTWASGTTGIVGNISATNSLVGSTMSDSVGGDGPYQVINGVTALSNGNYVVDSPEWGDVAGAVTWGSGVTGVAGTVSAANSLVGSSAGDELGYLGYNGVTALSNGNYLVDSPNWDYGLGAVTWGSGATGVAGTISAANSLVGSIAGDDVGFGGHPGYLGVTVLSNGNYVVESPYWDNGLGAVTWGSGATGVAGTISAANSLVGSAAYDTVGLGGVTALSNGNYAVDSPYWGNGLGAVTWGSGGTGVAGTISADNSLVGSTAGDDVGSGGVTALGNGNYVVDSPAWDKGLGAVTWGSGTTGVVGTISAANSLVGSIAGDGVGSGGVTALGNGNYVVDSPAWDKGLGAVTWGSGTTGGAGAISAANSLVGSIAGDGVNASVTALSNGNYVVDSPAWNNGTGAATWGSGATGVVGTISAANSIIGGSANAGLQGIVVDNVNGTFYAPFTTDASNGGGGQVRVGSQSADVVIDAVQTTAATNVTVTYDIYTDTLTQPFEIGIYRANANQFGSASQAEEVASYQVTNLAPGHYTQIVSFNQQSNQSALAAPLVPDGSLPYVLAVAGANGTLPQSVSVDNSQGHFAIYTVGAVVPGFLSDVSTPSWLDPMAESLSSAYGSHGLAFALPWNATETVPGQVTAAAQMLYQDILGAASFLISANALQPNDIIDVQLIGHSRGGDVVDQAMQYLTTASGLGQLSPQLAHGYYQMTLLDPHPANASTISDASFNPLVPSPPQTDFAIDSSTYDDPPIVIPARVNQLLDVYQKNTYSSVSSIVEPPASWESAFNLKGLSLQEMTIPGQGSSTLVTAFNVTSQGLGHSEVPEWAAQYFIPGLLQGELPPYATGSSAPTLSPANQLLVVPGQFTLDSQGNLDPGVNSPFTLYALALDSTGNVDPNYTGQVSVALANNSGQAALGGTLTTNAVNGVAAFSGLTVSSSGSGFTFAASSPGLTAGTSPPMDVEPDQLVVTTPPPATVTAGNPFGLVVTAEDGSGKTDTSFTGNVTVSLNNSTTTNATLVGTTTVAAVAGVATFSGLSVDEAGDDWTLSVNAVGAATAQTSAVDVSAGTVNQLQTAMQPAGNITAGSNFAIVVSAEDSAGNVDPTFNGNVTLSLMNNPSGGTLGGALTVPAIDGVADFAGLTIDNPGSGYAIRAASNSLSTTSAVTVSAPATATQLVVTTQPANSVVPGASVGLVVTAEDGFGTIDTSFNGNVTVALNELLGQSGTLGGTVTKAAVKGVATFSGLTITAPGTFTLQATSTGLDTTTTNSFHILFLPSFTGLFTPSITYGTASTAISGTLNANASGVGVPSGETVQVTLNGVTQSATLDSNDSFSTTFGTSALSVTGSPFTISFAYPGDAAFSGATGTSSLTVTKATPTIAWVNPSFLVAGTSLSATQLNAVASVAGSYTYTLGNGAAANGVALGAGLAQTLNVAFTPSDTADYNTAAASVAIDVVGSSNLATVASFMEGLQFTSETKSSFGAILRQATSNGPGDYDVVTGLPIYEVDPYFANLGVLALLQTQAPDSLQTASRWISWYLGHLNSNFTINNYFYMADGTPGTPKLYPNSVIADADDSNASTFLAVVDEFCLAGGSTAFLQTPSAATDVQGIAAMLASLQQHNGLTWDFLNLPVTVPGEVEYLEDNAESGAGLTAAANLETILYQLPATAQRYATAAAGIVSGIQTIFYDPSSNQSLGLYDWADVVSSTGVLTPSQSNLSTWYPDTESQAWPFIFGVLSPSSPTALQEMQRVDGNWHGASNWPTTQSTTPSMGYFALLTGDTSQGQLQVATLLQNQFTSTPPTLTVGDAGWLLRSLSTESGNYPTSSVKTLPARESTTTFTVNWSSKAFAGGPAIASYDVFVSDDGGAFTEWLTNTSLTAAAFVGQDGHTYSFFSVATDALNNVQPAPSSAQASTTVAAAPIVDGVSPSSGPAGLSTRVTITGLYLLGTTSVKFGTVAGTIVSDTATQIVVTSPAGSLGKVNITVTTAKGTSATSAADDFTFVPVVHSNATSVAATATSLTITGTSFSTTASNDKVTFSGGATGTVTTATATTLTVTSLKGLLAGKLTASVAVSGVSSGTAVEVANVTPVVTSNTATLAANAPSLTIKGVGFSSTAGNDTVKFNNGATGKVTSATSTALTVTSLTGLVSGSLTVIVTSNGASNATAVQVATVTPVVTKSTANLGVNATTLVIHGYGFSATAANDKVTFSGSVTGTVTSATNTQLTVTKLAGLKLGALTASVKVDSESSGTAVQVATVVPVVTLSTANLAASATSLTIHGFGFSTTASSDKVTFSGGATGTVTTATTTTLTVTSLKGLIGGKLLASVSVSGVSSGAAVQVATVSPMVTKSTASLALSATTLTIKGFGFDPTAANDKVIFSNGVTGTVSTATNNQLVIINLTGLVAGPLTAIVDIDNESSGTPVEVADVT